MISVPGCLSFALPPAGPAAESPHVPCRALALEKSFSIRTFSDIRGRRFDGRNHGHCGSFGQFQARRQGWRHCHRRAGSITDLGQAREWARRAQGINRGEAARCPNKRSVWSFIQVRQFAWRRRRRACRNNASQQPRNCSEQLRRVLTAVGACIKDACC